MNKRMIVNWLKDEQARALDAVKAQAKLNQEQAYKDIWETVGLPDAAQRLQTAIDEFQHLAQEFEKTLDAVEGVTLRQYHQLSGQVYCLTNSADSVRKFIVEGMIDPERSPVFQRIQKQRRELEAGVIANYTAAIENVKIMKDAKAAMDYLAGLGFDLTSLKKLDEPQQTTAVALPVDTRYLFVGGNA